MEDFQYIICPIISWFVTGIIKFIVNVARSDISKAINLIGYGGFPSNHSSIITSMFFLILFNEGFSSPVFGIIFTVAIIILMDAKSLRGQITKHAIQINNLNKNNLKEKFPLREKIGHSMLEIVGGCLIGFCVAYFIYNNI
jgi:acid phosphatase family membrane protein YuiD